MNILAKSKAYDALASHLSDSNSSAEAILAIKPEQLSAEDLDARCQTVLSQLGPVAPRRDVRCSPAEIGVVAAVILLLACFYGVAGSLERVTGLALLCILSLAVGLLLILLVPRHSIGQDQRPNVTQRLLLRRSVKLGSNSVSVYRSLGIVILSGGAWLAWQWLQMGA